MFTSLSLVAPDPHTDDRERAFAAPTGILTTRASMHGAWNFDGCVPEAPASVMHRGLCGARGRADNKHNNATVKTKRCRARAARSAAALAKRQAKRFAARPERK